MVAIPEKSGVGVWSIRQTYTVQRSALHWHVSASEAGAAAHTGSRSHPSPGCAVPFNPLVQLQLGLHTWVGHHESDCHQCVSGVCGGRGVHTSLPVDVRHSGAAVHEGRLVHSPAEHYTLNARAAGSALLLPPS